MNKKILVAISIFVIIIVLAVFALGSKKSATIDPGGSTYDSTSGDTISNPPGKTPEAYGNTNSQQLFLGFDKLLEYGVTTSQLDATKKAFANYTTAKNQSVKTVSIAVNTITAQASPSDGSKQSAYFDVVLDQKTTLKARLDYFEISSVNLYLYTGNPSVSPSIFDSGVVDTSSGD